MDAATPLPTILFVDDEPNILSSLRRLFRGQGYRILTADSGAAGLELLRQQAVDLVISDMRMPIMSGAQFLEAVRSEWPGTMRLLLTGYADVQSILDAINRGEIYRYITKPWDDNDIQLIVRHTLERQRLQHEKQRLELLTHTQNEALKALNASLEDKVRQRTADLSKAHDGLLCFNAKLKTNFLLSIKVFSNLIEMRGGGLAGHALRVADLARKLAVRLDCDDATVQDVFVAAMLHNIGQIGLSDELLALPQTAMSGEQLGQYRKHPVRAEQLLMPLDELRGAALLVRAHQERFDGTGYPDQLAALAIPLGARILALASDYDKLQIGMMMPKKLRPEEARAAVLHSRGKRYDPAVVDAFVQMLDAALVPVREPAHATVVVPVAAVQPGMTLAKDLVLPDGSLLLSADHVLDAGLVRQIINYEKTLLHPLRLTVYHD
ncbi:response regulator [Actimicrobium sp. CCC2.4]|uniref:HD domain-containing phosphohydrolase n=1 Tax=Actimicrobium sp. CCC2.4 TaxID=3048606 RepID=UPI002AC8C244|nr:HD domain-containing phosphohydrolase [Actimicrobium sp. CCC2.4]MEB0136898.1 response regulator [Actimicrobium sp. CCC2.4]WPX33448.1 response regulator [Actimicrobium sp. CCC2.4]